MKKKGAIFSVIILMMIIPALSGTSNAKADDITGVGTILEAVVDLFCPEHPQNRCKHGECKDGACISFRKACSTNDDCK